MPDVRKPLMSGNWKMHHNHFEAIAAVQKLSYNLTPADYEAVDVSVHPPFTDLRSIQTIIDADRLDLLLGAQHCHWEDKGAFTGEIAPPMLAKLQVDLVIAGHSERRELFGEPAFPGSPVPSRHLGAESGDNPAASAAQRRYGRRRRADQR